MIQFFPCVLADVQHRCRHCHARFTVLCYLFICPPQKLFFCALALVSFCFVLSAVCFFISADIISVNVQIVFPDRINPRVHPCPVNRHLDRLDVPAYPEFYANRFAFWCNADCERITAEIIAPPAILKAAAHRLQGAEQIVPVKVVWIAYCIRTYSKRPIALFVQYVCDCLFRRACCAAAHIARFYFTEHDLIPQRVDHVLQLYRPCFPFNLTFNRLYSPYNSLARFSVIPDPIPHSNCRNFFPHSDRCRALPF